MRVWLWYHPRSGPGHRFCRHWAGCDQQMDFIVVSDSHFCHIKYCRLYFKVPRLICFTFAVSLEPYPTFRSGPYHISIDRFNLKELRHTGNLWKNPQGFVHPLFQHVFIDLIGVMTYLHSEISLMLLKKCMSYFMYLWFYLEASMLCDLQIKSMLIERMSCLFLNL